jgi:phosphohistidine swiveling domain-containing protein
MDVAPLTDPTHMDQSPGVLWTTINTAEAIPGVSTPLNWSFYRDAIEAGIRGSWVDLGVLPTSADTLPTDPGQCFTGMFFGRLATNLDQWRYVADRMPGTSGDAMEQQFFGTVRPGVASAIIRRRYPFVAVKAPAAAVRAARTVRALRADAHRWWRECLSRIDNGQARAVLIDAEAMFARATRPHLVASMIASGVFEQVVANANRVGQPGAERTLLTGMGAFEETVMMTAIWEASRGRRTIDDVVRHFGYHGPAEGEISSRSWREDRTPLTALVDRYAEMADARDPRSRQEARIRERKAAERLLLRATAGHRQPAVRTILRLAHTYLTLREVGRAVFLYAFDAGRAAAREHGHDLVRSGELDDPDDVFFLSMSELRAELPSNVRELVAFRRARHAHHQLVTVPSAFVGLPTSVPLSDPVEDATAAVAGIGVSPGIVEATARVIHDQAKADDLDDGDVLVCHTTDPSWSSLFLAASAVVIDIGSAMSHGAIVARELGIPCVINTTDGTRRIPSGARVRVDGGAGTVDILS